jgi:hypothetical protein
MEVARFQVLTAASMKMAVFRVVAPYSLVEVYSRFRGAYCHHHQGDNLPDYMAQQPRRTAILNGSTVLTSALDRVSRIALMMEAARTSETLINLYQTTRCYNPEDSNLHK